MLTVEELFDLTHTDHAEIFKDVKYAWEVLPLLEEYIEYTLQDSTSQGDVSPHAHVGERVSLGAGTIVEPGAVIQGPAIIGENCVIRSNAYIRENVIIGDNCIVGNSTEVKNALLFDEVAIPHFNYVGDSILGYKVHLGSSVILSNVKTPIGEIKVVTLQETIQTGLEKFGALIGDRTEIGASAVLNPGSVIGKECLIYPTARFRGVRDSHSIVKIRQTQEVVIKKQV